MITTYRAEFIGKTKNAIGSNERFRLLVDAESEETAKTKLYETHEHIETLQLTPLSVQALAYMLEAENLALKRETNKSLRSGKGPSEEMGRLRRKARITWHRWSNARDAAEGRTQAFPSSPTT